MCACLGLIALSPLLLIFAFAVWAGSGWPIFFRQQRVGRKGRNFTLLKFRTMTVKGRAKEGEEGKSQDEGTFDAGDTSRVTPIGRFLRKSKMDELPQLWNVVRGDMSLVGPRPEVRKWVDVYPDRWANVLTVRPGITDPASIQYRNEEEILAAASDPERTYRKEILPLKLNLYENYVRSRTFAGDIQIILETFKALFR